MKGSGIVEEKERAGRWKRPALIGCCLLLPAALLISFGVWRGGEDRLRGGPASPATPGLRNVRIALADEPHASHAFLFAAEAKGFLREQGFALEPVIAGDADDPLRMVAEGRADLALAGQPDVLFARMEGEAVVSIAAIVRSPLVYLMVPKDSPIHHPAHLAGKTVAWSGSPVHAAVLDTMLDSVKEERPEVTLVAADGRYAGLLQSGRADALIGPTILEGRRRLERAGWEMRTIEPMLYGVPPYYETVLVAGERALAEDGESFTRMWLALAEGFEYVAEHPAEAAEWLAAAGVFGESPDRTASPEWLEQTLPFMRAIDAPFGSQDRQIWKETAKWLAERHLPDALTVLDDAFIHLADHPSD